MMLEMLPCICFHKQRAWGSRHSDPWALVLPRGVRVLSWSDSQVPWTPRSKAVPFLCHAPLALLTSIPRLCRLCGRQVEPWPAQAQPLFQAQSPGRGWSRPCTEDEGR